MITKATRKVIFTYCGWFFAKVSLLNDESTLKIDTKNHKWHVWHQKPQYILWATWGAPLECQNTVDQRIMYHATVYVCIRICTIPGTISVYHKLMCIVGPRRPKISTFTPESWLLGSCCMIAHDEMSGCLIAVSGHKLPSMIGSWECVLKWHQPHHQWPHQPLLLHGKL
jgi:hypothetical protein